ncbi:MAG: hypothetical protein WDW36_005102 [Sanguina aurantia]
MHHSAGISGYTPATYISYADDPAHMCHHTVCIEVNASAAECYALWDDFCRLVDFLDLIGQIGLDPESPTMGLFQCFYRWGQMPVMEIVFVLEKTSCIEDQQIDFTSVWGLPLTGSVQFSPAAAGSRCQTLVTLDLSHQLPRLLVDMGVGKFGVEGHVKPILKQNLDTFKSLAEALASPDPSSAPARQEPSVDQAYEVSHLGPGAADNVEMTDDGELAFFSSVPKTEPELIEWQLQKAASAREQRAQEIRELQAAEGSTASGSEADLQRQRSLRKLQELEVASLRRAEPPTESALSPTSGSSSSRSTPAGPPAPAKRMGRPPGSVKAKLKSGSPPKPKVKRVPRMYDSNDSSGTST